MKLSNGYKLLLLGILILFFLILIAYELYEGFVDKKPKSRQTPVRSNNTCSDPEMEYMYDRFSKAILKDPQKPCDAGYAISDYFGLAYCLPVCEAGYTQFSNDTTYCVRTDGMCKNSDELSNNIETNWNRVCAPLYKMNVNTLSTMGSISTVISTINGQYNFVNSNFFTFSNTVERSATTNATNLMLRNTIFNNNIVSNYFDIRTLKDSINSNFIMMSNKKDKFNYIFNSFDCANYM